jgi:hypothetical protein
VTDTPVDEPSDGDEELSEFELGFRIGEIAGRCADVLHGATWRWTQWSPTPAVLYEPETGPTILYDPEQDRDAPYDPSRESPSAFDHDHCHFCYENSFSTYYDFDANEGWTTSRPPGIPEREQDDYVWWVCTRCFELLREQFEWNTEPVR